MHKELWWTKNEERDHFENLIVDAGYCYNLQGGSNMTGTDFFL